ncbi:MAG: DegT/DnrJ/EryC1/StrS family aminotransferase, partial [Bacteroidales bacterium]
MKELCEPSGGTEKIEIPMKDMLRLSKPYIRNKKKFFRMLNEILDTGFLTQGKYVELFENKIAQYLQVKHAVAVSSGTAALHLSLAAIGINHKDEVIVPAYTFPATANAIEMLKAKAVLADVNLSTFNIDTEKIEKKITSQTKAIIPVHLFGNPADMGSIMKIAEKYNLIVIEDAAGALGSSYRNKKCGTIGNLGCFSFHPRKIITTFEGGIIVTNDEGINQKLRILRNHGLKVKGLSSNLVECGYNYRLSEAQAALGIIQIDILQDVIMKRKKIFNTYANLLQKIPGISLQECLPDCDAVWQTLVIRLKNPNAHEIINCLRNRGIEANIGTYALHLTDYYKSRYKNARYPVAQELYERCIALPFYNEMKQSEIKQVVKVLKETLYEFQ